MSVPGLMLLYFFIVFQGICGPGLTCSVIDSGAGSQCVKMTGPHCMVQQAAFDTALAAGQLGMDQRRPQCDAEGDWAPVQCSGAGVCRCVSKVRIQLTHPGKSLVSAQKNSFLRVTGNQSLVWRPT